MVSSAAVEQERETGRARSRGSRAARGPPEGAGRIRGDFRGAAGGGGVGAAAWRARASGRAGERSSARAEGAASPPEGASALGRPARAAGRGEEDEAPPGRSAGSAGSHTMALAEVVVCAVGRVVTLPAVEITAQATALLVLVMLSAAEDNGRGPPLFSGARGRPDGWTAGAETVSSPRSRRGCGPGRRPRRLPEPGGERSLRDCAPRGAAEDAAQLSARNGFGSCGLLVCVLSGFVLEVHGRVGERLREAQVRSRSEQSTLEVQTFMS